MIRFIESHILYIMVLHHLNLGHSTITSVYNADIDKCSNNIIDNLKKSLKKTMDKVGRSIG